MDRSEFLKRIGNLLTVKSIVTLILTVIFAVLALRGEVGQDFMTVYTMIISFFFGYSTMKDWLPGKGKPCESVRKDS